MDEARQRQEVERVRLDAIASANFWQIAEVVGPEAAQNIVHYLRRGGKRQHRGTRSIPKAGKRLAQDHFLVRTIGRKKAELLQEKFGGENLELGSLTTYSKRLRDRLIFQWADQGASVEMIFHMLRDGGHELSVDRVKEILRGPRPGAPDPPTGAGE